MSDIDSHTANQLVDHLFREQAGKMTTILIRLFGFRNAELAEDIVQETFISAMKNWPVKGQPENPSAWLMQVAKNKALNVVKREKRILEKSSLVEKEVTVRQVEQLFEEQEIEDSQLRMLFTCCYSEIAPREQIMLILNILGGFNNAEIGSALLMSSSAVKKAIYRSKNKIKSCHYHLPEITKKEIYEREETVLQAIYLIFNEGYRTSFSDKILNDDLCFTALRLASLVLNMESDNSGKIHALVSLMYFNIARFPARTQELGIIVLEDQERTKWDQKLINKGFHHLKKSRHSDALSTYHLEAAIASVHCAAPAFEDTNWELISEYYRKLVAMTQSPVIELNYVIALSYLKGPDVGIDMLEKLELSLPKGKKYVRSAALAEMNARGKKFGLAKSYYQIAADQANSEADVEFLQRKMEECDRKALSKN